MAFRPGASAPPPVPVPTPALAEGEIGHDALALGADAQALHQRELKNPSTVEGDVADARERAVRSMNAARLLAPALRAAAAEGGDDRVQAARFVEILERANANALHATQVWGLDAQLVKNRWAMNSLERVFVEALAAVPPAKDDPALVEALVEAADVRQCRKEFWEELSEPTGIHASLLKGLIPVWQAQRQFDFLRPQDAALRECAQRLLDTAGQAVVHLVSPLTPASERRTLFGIFLEEGGVILAEAWRERAQHAQSAMAGRSAQALAAWRKANPEGLPMDSVWTTFRQQMARLVKLAGSSRPQVRAPRA